MSASVGFEIIFYLDVVESVALRSTIFSWHCLVDPQGFAMHVSEYGRPQSMSFRNLSE